MNITCSCRKIFPKYLDLLRLYSTRTKNVLKEENLRSSPNKLIHCFRTLFPWENADALTEYLASSIIYNKDGLLALNKPFGIKIHGHDKPGTRYEKGQRFVIPSIPDCNYTIEDCLPALQKHLNLPPLSIVKSAEKYTSGVVLLSTSDKVAAKVKKSFNAAKLQRKPHLVHWAVTLGFSAVSYRNERVGIKFLESKNGKVRQPVIETEFSKRSCKLKIIYPVQVEVRTISINKSLCTSLVEIASSSVRWHFVRVYASSRVAPILGDIMYGSRMKTLLGIPVKVQLQNSFTYGPQILPEKMCESLNLPKSKGSEIVPTMLHLRSIVLPNFQEKDQDLVITAELPPHFLWATEKLGLICK